MGGYQRSCRVLAYIINGDEIVTGTGWNVFVHPSARGAHKPGALLTKRGGRLPFLLAQLAQPPVGGRGLRQRQIFGDGDERVEVGGGGDAVEEMPRQFHAGVVAAAQCAGLRGDGLAVQRRGGVVAGGGGISAHRRVTR